MEETQEKATQDEQAELNTPSYTQTRSLGLEAFGIRVSNSNSSVHHPSHYNWFGIECIDVAEHFGFNSGNAIKYIWRAEYKDDPIEDLQKALWYIQREIERLSTDG